MWIIIIGRNNVISKEETFLSPSRFSLEFRAENLFSPSSSSFLQIESGRMGGLFFQISDQIWKIRIY